MSGVAPLPGVAQPIVLVPGPTKRLHTARSGTTCHLCCQLAGSASMRSKEALVSSKTFTPTKSLKACWSCCWSAANSKGLTSPLLLIAHGASNSLLALQGRNQRGQSHAGGKGTRDLALRDAVEVLDQVVIALAVLTQPHQQAISPRLLVKHPRQQQVEVPEAARPQALGPWALPRPTLGSCPPSSPQRS